MTPLLIVAVVILVVLADIAYLLRQVIKRLDYQSLESARQSLYLKEIRTHALMTRRYAQHLSRRTRAPQEVKHHVKDFLKTFYNSAIEGETPAGQ